MKALNRALIEAGLITMKDSPNGKRYGRRDRKGRIVEAYGFDLSPLAARHAEFVRLAEEAKAERAEMARLRRRATIARNGITQILETAAEYGFAGEEWLTLSARRGASRWRSGRSSGRRRWRLASRAWSGGRFGARAPGKPAAVGGGSSGARSCGFRPQGAGKPTPQYTYKPSLYPEQDTVMAPEGCKSASVGAT